MENQTWKKSAAGIKFFRTGIMTLYHELKGDEKSFKHVLKKNVLSYKNKQFNTSLYDLAKQHGLEAKLDEYIQKELIESFKGKLLYGLKLTYDVKDSLDEVLEGIETAASVAAGAPTAGAGAVAIEGATKGFEIPYQLIAQTIMGGILGVVGDYTDMYDFDTEEGRNTYLKDVGMLYVEGGAKVIPFLDTVAEFALDFGTIKNRIMDASAKKAERWLINTIRKERDLSLEQRVENARLPRGFDGINDDYLGDTLTYKRHLN